MKRIIFIFIFILLQKSFMCQGTFKITTDKIKYAYGDSIIVKTSVTNNTDTSFTLIGSSTCFMGVKFNDLRMSTMCTLDQHEFHFSPGTSLTWIWYLDPKDLGIPDKEGVQKIVGSCGKLRDTVYITAPKFLGGIVAVGLIDSIPESEYQSLRDSINATVIYRSLGPLVYEYWRIVNHSVDSLVEKYTGDYRLGGIDAIRRLEFNKQIVTSIKLNYSIPPIISLSQNYPNPFNPKTRIKFDVPNKTFIELSVYDIKGAKIINLLKDEYFPGNYFVEFDGSFLSSGVYFYQLKSANSIITKKMLLLK